MIICTVCCNNHLPLSLNMAKSAKQHHPFSELVLCLVEEEIHPIVKDFPYFDRIVLAKDIGIPDFDKFVFKYNQYEAACAVKPYLLSYLVNEYKHINEFIYLDSDMKVYSPLEEVRELLQSKSIMVTPHNTEPVEINYHEEFSRLRDGVINGGFIAINRSKEAKDFLYWWAERCRFHCYIDYKNGLFLDQKWLEFVPCFFPNSHLLLHPGYNIANWNFTKRNINKGSNGQYVVNGEPVRFVHFSGLENIYLPDKTNFFSLLRDEYLDEITEMKYRELKDIAWSYNYFTSGEQIKPRTKIYYRHNQKLQDKFPFPFKYSNRVLARREK
ncbi:hypothetical protein [Bacillus sp. EB01]|uniref:hypothetical protein n=1 Tax=Bacillus sp. EB01 TaxID=1347086 RepID=UPI000693BDA5|nr:hypothetical protein [Bacillus sp. EB01]